MAAFPSRDREAFMAHWAKLLADPSVIRKTVLLDGEVAGNVVSFDAGGERLVGYWIGRELWGRGAATGALAGLLAHETRRPLLAHVAKHNAGSIRVLEKHGFAVVREETVSVGGETVAELVMALA
jgi:RimJ/RimL family protein N-acetyltransferase